MTKVTYGLNQALCSADQKIIIGVDEVGRGPLAGPVVAAAVILSAPLPETLSGLNDSKKLSAKKRARLNAAILETCAWAIAEVPVEDVDRLNIFGATMLAMTKAVATLCAQGGYMPDDILIDGKQTPQGRVPEWKWDARAIVGGDGLEAPISAASIIAKEYRDALMSDLAKIYPHYGWERNAGYGTKAHMEGLQAYGPTEHHRRSFAPVARLWDKGLL